MICRSFDASLLALGLFLVPLRLVATPDRRYQNGTQCYHSGVCQIMAKLLFRFEGLSLVACGSTVENCDVIGTDRHIYHWQSSDFAN